MTFLCSIGALWSTELSGSAGSAPAPFKSGLADAPGTAGRKMSGTGQTIADLMAGDAAAAAEPAYEPVVTTKKPPPPPKRADAFVPMAPPVQPRKKPVPGATPDQVALPTEASRPAPGTAAK